MSRFWISIFAMLWVCGIGFGVRSMAHYEATPGVAATPSLDFPYTRLIKMQPTKPTVMMFAHPRCSCSRASLTELSQIAQHCAGKAQIVVLFFMPRHADTGWLNTDLRQRTAEIPGVTVLEDREGVEAKRFHAETSGETIVYDAHGRLLFHGGITARRGHEGDNAGRKAIESLLNHQQSVLRQTPVFGCSLSRRSFAAQEGKEQCRK